MAIQASDLIHQWPVHPIFVKCLVNHILVAFPAQLSGLLFGLEGIWRGGFWVALLTLSFGNGSVGNIKHDSSFVGTVGAVAGVTVRSFHGVILVFSGKRELISLMAFQAEGRHIFFQERI
jgi:hypothetical protein